MNIRNQIPYQLKELSTFNEMRPLYPLLQELNPKLTQERYEYLLQKMCEQGNYFQVGAFYEGECLGLTGVWIGHQIWCGKFLEIDNFIVSEKYRKQGIGQALVKWVEKRAIEEKCEMMRLDTYVVLDQAHRFYFSQGFKILGFHMIKKIN